MKDIKKERGVDLDKSTKERIAEIERFLNDAWYEAFVIREQARDEKIEEFNVFQHVTQELVKLSNLVEEYNKK